MHGRVYMHTHAKSTKSVNRAQIQPLHKKNEHDGVKTVPILKSGLNQNRFVSGKLCWQGLRWQILKKSQNLKERSLVLKMLQTLMTPRRRVGPTAERLETKHLQGGEIEPPKPLVGDA